MAVPTALFEFCGVATADGSRPVRLRTGQQRNEGGSQQHVQSWPSVVAISSAKGQSCRSPALYRHGHAVTEGGSAGSPSRLGVSVNWLVGGEVRGAKLGAAASGEGDTSFMAWLSGHGISAYGWLSGHGISAHGWLSGHRISAYGWLSGHRISAYGGAGRLWQSFAPRHSGGCSYG